MKETNPPSVNRLGADQLLAFIPTQLGYHPGEQHLVAVGLLDRRVGPMLAAAYEPEVAGYDEFNDYLAETIVKTSHKHQLSSWIIVAYGTLAQARADLLTADLERNGVRVAAIHTVTSGRFQTLTEDGWSAPTPLGVDELGLSHGLSDALASIEQVRTAMQPDPIPSIPLLPASERAQFDVLSPSGHVVKARELLDELANAGAEPVPRTQARLAHLICSSRAVRDNVISHAIAPANAPGVAEQRTDVLLRLYKGADPTIRPQLAAAAAATCYYNGRGGVHIAPILEHALPSEELARHVTVMLEQTGNGTAQRATHMTAAQEALRTADAFWTRHRNDPHTALPAGMHLAPPAPASTDLSLG